MPYILTRATLEDSDLDEGIVSWYNERFSETAPDFQTVLNALAEDDLPDFAAELMSRIDADDETVVSDDVVTGKNLFFAGSVQFNRGLSITGTLLVNGNIGASGKIRVEKDLRTYGELITEYHVSA